MKTITLKHLNKTEINVIAYHYGKDSSKSLIMASNPATGEMLFMVEKNHLVVLETIVLESAIEEYNSAD